MDARKESNQKVEELIIELAESSMRWVATKIFEDFGGLLCLEFIIGQVGNMHQPSTTLGLEPVMYQLSTSLGLDPALSGPPSN